VPRAVPSAARDVSPAEHPRKGLIRMTNDTAHSRPQGDRGGGLGGALGRGLGAGLAAGAIWWIVETTANWAFGGVIPASAALTMLGIDLAIGGVAGLVVGAILAFLPGGGVAALALGLTAAFGLIRIYEPPGLRAEALYVVLAAAGVWLGVRLAGARRGWLAFVHLALLTTAAAALGKAGVSEVQSTYFGHAEPSGVTLPLLLTALPLAAIVGDRALALVLRPPALRLAAQVAAVVLAAVIWGKPFSTAPLIDPAFATAAPRAGTPDVILISLDTTRADHMSTYGYARETSPRLSELARDGLNFTQARSPAQWTVPGHASMFTGLFPTSHGAHYAGGWHSGPLIYGRRRVFPLAEDKVTLAEVLRERGYATGAFVANFANLYRGFGMAQGFQRYEDQPGLLLRPVPHAVRFVQRFVPTFFKKPFRSAQELNAAALVWLDQQPADRPAFVFLNYLEPHHWLAPPPYDLWARDLPNARRLALRGLFTHAIPAGLTEEEREFITANYDGQILAMDAALGELFDALRARGRYENAVIIVTSDHGELLGEHDQVGHGGRMMYEGLLHVPMVVKLPGPDRPRGEVPDQVQIVDILPTVLEVLGVPPPPGVQGQPLQRVTRKSLAEEHINPEFVAHYGNVYNRAMRVLYDGPYKLITTSQGERLLFDLTRDRGEERNLASREPDQVARMEQELERKMSRMEAKIASAAPEGRP
jgi:arylsulfatase A-like enzyme